jgi:2-C-methyl-D-erythritol 4-phosphate cytidylyltransferase
MFDAIILLAGKGERSGLEYNKIFYRINNKLLFRFSLETFLSCNNCRKVVLVCREEELETVKEMTIDLPNLEYTVGGKYRQDSVKRGMALCSSQVVLIHDGARPFVKVEEIEKVYQATLRSEAAVLAVRVVDTIVEVKESYRNLEREFLWKVMTPQGVIAERYREALSLGEAERYYATDDVGLLVRYLKIKPEIVPGNKDNLKVTNAFDLKLIEFLSRRDG